MARTGTVVAVLSGRRQKLKLPEAGGHAAGKKTFPGQVMALKPKKIMIRIVFTAGISVMIFGVTGQAAAGEPVLSRLLFTDPSSFLMPDRNAGLKRSDLHPQLEPGPPYHRTGPHRPYLGFGWDRDAGNRCRWNIVFGLGLYISNSRDWYHPGDELSPEAPKADGEQADLFEKIQNALQVVGFQVRYAF